MLFLYLFAEVKFNILYVKNIVTVVAIRVITDSIRGNIELVSSHTSDHAKFCVILKLSQSIKTIISMIILHTIHAIKLHAEFIKASWNSNLFGQNHILFFIIFVNYIYVYSGSYCYKAIS